jgi:hypothetical protein
MSSVERCDDPDEALVALLRGHILFALHQTSLITVHVRDLVHAPEPSRQRVKELQKQYVDLWVDVLARRHTSLDARAAQAAVHAVFGLLNSTPHSLRISRAAMSEMLLDMALASFATLGETTARRDAG